MTLLLLLCTSPRQPLQLTHLGATVLVVVDIFVVVVVIVVVNVVVDALFFVTNPYYYVFGEFCTI